jgi:hypothetical protein
MRHSLAFGIHASVERVDPGKPTEVDRADTDAADPSALI